MPLFPYNEYGGAMDQRVEEIIASLDGIIIEIVVPLRKKVINEAALSELFGLMGELQILLNIYCLHKQ